MDPLVEKYPNISPYTYVANNPIYFIDPDGREIIIHFQKEVNGTMKNYIVKYEYGKKYKGDNQFVKDVFTALDYLINNNADVTNVIGQMSKSKEMNTNLYESREGVSKNIYPNDVSYHYGETDGTSNIIWDPNMANEFVNINGIFGWFGNGYSEQGQVSPAEVLLHEMAHALNFNKAGYDGHKNNMEAKLNNAYKTKEESNVIQNVEQPAAKALGREVVRKGHYGSFYKTTEPTSTEKKN